MTATHTFSPGGSLWIDPRDNKTYRSNGKGWFNSTVDAGQALADGPGHALVFVDPAKPHAEQKPLGPDLEEYNRLVEAAESCIKRTGTALVPAEQPELWVRNRIRERGGMVQYKEKNGSVLVKQVTHWDWQMFTEILDMLLPSDGDEDKAPPAKPKGAKKGKKDKAPEQQSVLSEADKWTLDVGAALNKAEPGADDKMMIMNYGLIALKLDSKMVLQTWADTAAVNGTGITRARLKDFRFRLCVADRRFNGDATSTEWIRLQEWAEEHGVTRDRAEMIGRELKDGPFTWEMIERYQAALVKEIEQPQGMDEDDVRDVHTLAEIAEEFAETEDQEEQETEQDPTTQAPAESADLTTAADTESVEPVTTASDSTEPTFFDRFKDHLLTEDQMGWLQTQDADYQDVIAGLDPDTAQVVVTADMPPLEPPTVNKLPETMNAEIIFKHKQLEDDTEMARRDDGLFFNPQTGEVDVPAVMQVLGWMTYPMLPQRPDIRLENLPEEADDDEREALQEAHENYWQALRELEQKVDQVGDIVATATEQAARYRRQAEKRAKRKERRAAFYESFIRAAADELALAKLPRIQTGENAGKIREKTLHLESCSLSYKKTGGKWKWTQKNEAIKHVLDQSPAIKKALGVKQEEVIDEAGLLSLISATDNCIEIKVTGAEGEEQIVVLEFPGVEFEDEEELGKLTISTGLSKKALGESDE